MKFFNISDPTMFFHKVLDCSGNVYCRDDQGALKDLKQAARIFADYDCVARPQILREIDVVAEQPDDFYKLYRYMMEMTCACV